MASFTSAASVTTDGKRSKVREVGEISYNNVDFGAFTETVGISSQPIESTDKRTIIYMRYLFTFRSYILGSPGDESADKTMSILRQRLQTPAGEFVYRGKGFGDFQVNVSKVKDVVWGPKPRVLSWKPAGGDQAGELTWSLEVCIPECDAAKYEFAVMEFNYKLSYKVDAAGYTTRVYSGFISIPQTRASADTRTITNSADKYREDIDIPVPLGFKRLPKDFNLSDDKCRLDFMIMDEEMPVALPDGVVSASATFNVQSDGYNVMKYVCSISGKYEMAKDVPRREAFRHFWKMAQGRMDHAKKNATQKFITPVGFSFQEPAIFGREAGSFTLSYVVLSSFASIIEATGMWLPVPGTSFATWKTSMKVPFSPRGFAGMKFDHTEDVIVDLCKKGTATLTTKPLEQAVLRAGELPAFDVPCPPPEDSWLDYRLRVRIEEHDNVVEMRPLPLKKPEIAKGQDTAVLVAKGLPADGGTSKQLKNTDGWSSMYSTTKGTPAARLQQRAEPSLYVILEGYALRACYPIDPPVITKIGGVEVQPANRRGHEGFRSGVEANWGHPIVGAVWRQRFFVPSIPAEPIGVPPSPVMTPKTDTFPASIFK